MIYYIYMFSGKLKLKVHKCILLRTGSQCNEMWSTIWVLRGCKTLQGKRLIDWLIDWFELVRWHWLIVLDNISMFQMIGTSFLDYGQHISWLRSSYTIAVIIYAITVIASFGLRSSCKILKIRLRSSFCNFSLSDSWKVTDVSTFSNSN